MPYAEVIGDPIEQSKSPAIHKHWLARLGLEGDYRAVHVRPDELASYVDGRRSDADWRGCNVTIPHKEAIAALIDDVTPEAGGIGAVNCVVRQGDRLIGYNSDVDGIEAAIGDLDLGGRDVAIVGAGGAARAMLACLSRHSPGAVIVIARDTVRATALRSAALALDLHFVPIGGAAGIFETAALIVNASPLGMTGSPEMPGELLAEIEANAIGSTLFDMVYQPLDTAFLRAGAAAGAETIDGLTMLIGQARRAFSLFFGQEAPHGDDALRAILTAQSIPASRTA
ncbi:MAG: shikimate dehydrogenase [Sphingomicrobium sp.]